MSDTEAWDAGGCEFEARDGVVDLGAEAVDPGDCVTGPGVGLGPADCGDFLREAAGGVLNICGYGYTW